MQPGLKLNDALKTLRRYLGLSQSQLAFQMGTTANSLARWESGKWPIGPTVLPHMRALVEAKLRDDVRKALAEVGPKLPLATFDGLLGHPNAVFFEDKKGRIYLRFITIGWEQEYYLHFGLDNRRWYAIGRDGRRRKVDKVLLAEIVKREKMRKGK